MNNRLQFIAFVTGFLILACWVSWSGGEPRWKGRTVSQWVIELGRHAHMGGLKGSREEIEQEVAELERRKGPAREAIRNLGPAAVPHILRQLKFEDQRPGWIEGLAKKFGWEWLQATPAVIRWIGAADAFATLGDQGTSALPELRRMLDDPKTAYRALSCLKAIGPGAIPTIESALSSPVVETRALVVMLVPELGTVAPALLPSVNQLLADTNPAVRTRAVYVRALIETNREHAVDFILRSLRNNAETAVGASRALQRLLKNNSVPPERIAQILPEFAKLVGGTHERNQVKILGLLLAFGLPGTNGQPEIIAAAGSATPEVRAVACLAMGAMTNRPALVLPLLADLASGDADEFVRRAALNAMSEFGEEAVGMVPPLAKELRERIESRQAAPPSLPAR